VTPQQVAVAEQVAEFWRERGYIPSISSTSKGPWVHAVDVNDGDRQALCATGTAKRGLHLATYLDLLRPPCRRCIMKHIYRLTGVKVEMW
jgi:hypothetical protein